jgi:hypothetical protein
MQTHSSVIENFIREGRGGKGTYVKATDDVLYSKIPLEYSPYGVEAEGGGLGVKRPNSPCD